MFGLLKASRRGSPHMININTVENNCAALFVEDVQINDLRETAFQASCAGDAEAATSTGVGG